MRHLPAALIALASVAAFDLAPGRAAAAPFEPRTIPDQIQVVGHLDIDALRSTQLFTALGGQAAIATALGHHAPAELRPLARALIGSVRGISFWRGDEHGAVYVETRDAKAIARLIVKLPAKRVNDILGFPTYSLQ